MNYPKVIIIVLNWNNFSDSMKCLDSIKSISYPNYDVIIVDNGSTDNSVSLFKTQFSHYKIICNKENEGFSRGCNVGIASALQDHSCRYVLLVNNDATVTAHFLEKAVEAAENDPRIGLVGGKILESPESKLIWYAGGKIIPWLGRVKRRGYREIDRGQFEQQMEINFVTGALMLIKREVLEKVGFLPEEYFFGYEEYDYSITVKRAGYSLVYVPEFLVYHQGDGSHYNYDPKYIYIANRQKFIFMEKHIPFRLFSVYKFIFYIYTKYFFYKRVSRMILKYYPEKKDIMIAALPELRIAMLEAIRDHGKDILTEKTLFKFAEKFRQIKESKKFN